MLGTQRNAFPQKDGKLFIKQTSRNTFFGGGGQHTNHLRCQPSASVTATSRVGLKTHFKQLKDGNTYPLQDYDKTKERNIKTSDRTVTPGRNSTIHEQQPRDDLKTRSFTITPTFLILLTSRSTPVAGDTNRYFTDSLARIGRQGAPQQGWKGEQGKLL